MANENIAGRKDVIFRSEINDNLLRQVLRREGVLRQLRDYQREYSVYVKKSASGIDTPVLEQKSMSKLIGSILYL